MAYKLNIGSFGWQFPLWENAYYPEDIPADWQFAYYANDYSIIMIPQKLVEQDLSLLEQCVQESEDSCLLLFELALEVSNGSISDLQNRFLEFINNIAFATERSLGIVCVFNLDEINALSKTEMLLLQESLKICQAQIDICIDLQGNTSLNEVSNIFLSILNTLSIDLCRYNNIFITEVNSATLHVTICEHDKCDAKQIRAIVENSLHAECDNSTNVLIFRTETPDHEQMHAAQIISDLL